MRFSSMDRIIYEKGLGRYVEVKRINWLKCNDKMKWKVKPSASFHQLEDIRPNFCSEFNITL